MNNSPYKIRFMRRDDLPQVAEIDKEAFPTQWPPTNYRSELQNNLARYLVVYKKDAEETVVKTVLQNKSLLHRIKRFFGIGDRVREQHIVDTIVGFVGGWIMADELHITEIAVRGDCRNQGIGRLMLIAIIEIGYELRARIGTLEVRRSNTSAQKLYEKFGFENVGFRKAYYTDNKEDAIIMTTPNFSLPEYQHRLTRLKTELAGKWGLSDIPGVKMPETVKR